jgi:DNA (cytosine-5)-methyltransferase 1
LHQQSNSNKSSLMQRDTFSYGSFFSGCGGFDLGFLERGFSHRAAIDIEPDAVENFSRNVRPTVWKADLLNGIPNERTFKGVDAIIAGPPCQGFSTAGRRLLDDPRNHMLPLTGELALRVRPKVLVVENVAGALAGEHAKYWNALCEMLRERGYRTHSMTIKATELGMAQMRKRVLLFAWRTGKDMIFIRPTRSSSSLGDILRNVDGCKNHDPKLLKRGSLERAIARRIRPGQKLSNVRGGNNAVPTWAIPEVFGPVTDEEQTVLELLRRLRRQERTRDCGDADPVSIARLERAFPECFRRIMDSLIRKGYVRRTGDKCDLVGTFNGKYRRLSWSEPSYTVDTRFGAPRYFLHPDEQRGFTVREAARIQGFSDNYVFCGSEQAQYRMIGNAVPPPLGKFAATIVKQLIS